MVYSPNRNHPLPCFKNRFARNDRQPQWFTHIVALDNDSQAKKVRNNRQPQWFTHPDYLPCWVLDIRLETIDNLNGLLTPVSSDS